MTASVLADLIPLADAHLAADEYRRGRYEWRDDGIGCTVRDAVLRGLLPADTQPHDHAALSRLTGVPELAWRLANGCFERAGLSWPRWLRACAAGTQHATLDARIVARLMRRLGGDALTDDVRAAAALIAGLYERRARGDEPDAAEWDAAADAAWRQADAARRQAGAAWRQAGAAWWSWCAEMICEEAAR